MSSKLITKISAKNDKKPIFRIEKEFSIGNIEQIKTELDEIVKDNTPLHLELKNMENFDLCAIQIIHALKKKLGTNFSYSVDIKEETKTILSHSGFNL